MTSLPERPSLPAEVLDRLFRALYGDAAARSTELERLCNEHPQHAAGIAAHVREFEHQATALAPDAIPESFGSYRIVAKLGEGAHGRVLLAEEAPPMQRRVALKVFRPLPRLAERFRAELQAVAMLNHDNIAKVFAAGEHDGEPYLVLEHVESALSIGRYCREHRLRVRDRIRLFLQAVHAVQHAHERGVLHLDLKPGNILVAEQEGRTVLKIVDFGQARVLAAGKAGSQVGTPPYMANEQFEGGEVDARTDVHALGVTLYELLADRLPHDERELADAATTSRMRDLYLREVPLPSERLRQYLAGGGSSSIRPTELRADLDWIVRKASARHAGDRPATARELALDLQRFLADQPVLARPATAGYWLRRAARRWRRQLAAGLVAVAIGGAGFVYWSAKPVAAATIEPFRVGTDFGAHLQPSEVRPGDALGVVVDLPRPARLAAVSLSTDADGTPWIHYTEPNLRSQLAELRHDVLLSLPAGRHEVLLCQVTPRSNDAAAWREGLWVFLLEDQDTVAGLQAWIERLRGAIQQQRIRGPLDQDTALELLRGVFADDGARGGPLDELPEARRRELAESFQRWSGDSETWPLPSPRPHVYWWSVRTTATGR